MAQTTLTHDRGGISKKTMTLYAAVRESPETVMRDGLKTMVIDPKQVERQGVLLFEELRFALEYAQNAFGLSEEKADVFAVDISGYSDDLYEDFNALRDDDLYMVFGRHTFLLQDIPASRLTHVHVAEDNESYESDFDDEFDVDGFRI